MCARALSLRLRTRKRVTRGARTPCCGASLPGAGAAPAGPAGPRAPRACHSPSSRRSSPPPPRSKPIEHARAHSSDDRYAPHLSRPTQPFVPAGAFSLPLLPDPETPEYQPGTRPSTRPAPAAPRPPRPLRPAYPASHRRRAANQHSTSRIQPCLSSASPSWIAISSSRSEFRTSNLPN